MPPTEIARARRRLEATHRPDPPFQVLMVPFELVVQVLRGAMLCRGQHGAYDLGITLRFICCNLGWSDITGVHGLLEEGMGRTRIPPVTEVDINDLPVLVDRAIDVPSASSDLQIGLIHAPAMTNEGAMCARRRNEPWGERAHPVVDRTRINADATLSQPLSDLSIAQPIAEIPPNSEGNDVIREAVAAEGRGGAIGDAADTAAAAV